MAHPYNEHRAHHVEHRRVGHILKGHGHHSLAHPHRADHQDEKEDRSLVKAMVKPSALKHKAHGGKVKHRLDKPHRKAGGRVKHRDDGGSVQSQAKLDERTTQAEKNELMKQMSRAKGGRVKHGKTNVNVIVGHGGQQPAPMPLPVPAAGPPMAAVPRPPVPMPAAPMGGPPMPPPGIAPGIPGMGPRKSGGRTYARGGGVKGVKPAKGYAQWKNATPVQHTDGKFANVHEKRGRQITYKRGGGV